VHEVTEHFNCWYVIWIIYRVKCPNNDQRQKQRNEITRSTEEEDWMMEIWRYLATPPIIFFNQWRCADVSWILKNAYSWEGCMAPLPSSWQNLWAESLYHCEERVSEHSFNQQSGLKYQGMDTHTHTHVRTHTHTVAKMAAMFAGPTGSLWEYR
jgi:hypothetical protein